MRWIRVVFAGAFVFSASNVAAAEFGRTPTPAEIKLWDIDVGPDGAALPGGSGTPAQGKQVYEQNCAGCHGSNGEGGIGTRLVGGVGTLASNEPIKTVGSYWPYAPTVFDYIRRAMPYTAPGSLSANDTYAVTAYILNLNKIVPSNEMLDRHSLPLVRMPNRDGFIPDAVFKLDNERAKSRTPGRR